MAAGAAVAAVTAEEAAVAEDLIFDRRREDYDPLQRILAIFAGRKAADIVEKIAAGKGV